MAKVTVLPAKIEFEATAGETIMGAAQAHGYYWPTTCSGQGICTTCLSEGISGSEVLAGGRRGGGRSAGAGARRGPQAAAAGRRGRRPGGGGGARRRRRGRARRGGGGLARAGGEA